MMKNKGLYIHTPYCAQKCKYCDFLSFANGDMMEDYFSALKKEISLFGEFQYGVDSVFIGGGTPSFIPSSYVKDFMETVRGAFALKEGAEITIEMNPESVSREKLEVYLKAGVNRFSMGVQSFNDESLRYIGRIHNSKRAIEAIGMIRSLGIENINIDMMMALPYQTFDDLKRDVEKLLQFNPNHLSYYSLILEEGTCLYDYYEKNPEAFPDEGLDRRMYHYLVGELENAGLRQYEISNFAKENYESRHNLKYWSLEEYIGLGLGSSSFIDKTRRKNTSDLSFYIYSLEKGRLPIESSEKITEKELMEDFMIFGIRKNRGVSKEEFKKLFSVELEGVYGKEVKGLMKDGLMEEEGDYLRLTKRGRDLSNLCELKFIK